MSIPSTTTTTSTLPQLEAEKTALIEAHKNIVDALNKAQSQVQSLQAEKISVEGQLFLVQRLERSLTPATPPTAPDVAPTAS